MSERVGARGRRVCVCLYLTKINTNLVRDANQLVQLFFSERERDNQLEWTSAEYVCEFGPVFFD